MPDSKEKFFESFYQSTDTDSAVINIPTVEADTSYTLALNEPGEAELDLKTLYEQCAPSIVAIYG